LRPSEVFLIMLVGILPAHTSEDNAILILALRLTG